MIAHGLTLESSASAGLVARSLAAERLLHR